MRDKGLRVGGQQQHRHGQKQFRTKFLVMLLFAASAAITWQFARQPSVSSLSYTPPKTTPAGAVGGDNSSLAYSSFIASRPSRPAYLYSVIPGGVASVEELQQVVAHDPVVAKQFEGFDFQHAHMVQVSEKQLMNVAYRVGDKVYWTRKKVALHRGEKLITDGKIVARARCGNRIAMAPLGPHAVVDPVEADFDQPLFSNDMVTREVEAQPEAYGALIPDGANALQPRKRKRLVPFFFLPFLGMGGGSSHTPLAVAPEPGTLLLLSSGLAGVYWKSRKSRRKK